MKHINLSNPPTVNELRDELLRDDGETLFQFMPEWQKPHIKRDQWLKPGSGSYQFLTSICAVIHQALAYDNWQKEQPLDPASRVHFDESTVAKRLAGNLGENAEPSGVLRMLSDGKSGRLQQLWRGEFGEMWLDVPTIIVGKLPPRLSDLG